MKGQVIRLDRIIIFFAIVSICLFVFFAGPYIAFADYKPLENLYVRAALIALIFVCYCMGVYRTNKKQTKTHTEIDKTLTEEVTSFDTQAAVQEEVILTSRMHKAMAYLKGKGLFSTHKIYSLPWYVLIGAPGAGKSSVLENSSLTPLMDDAIHDGPIQGKGGTRYCDWWLTDQAILIDTAGRYTTQNKASDVEEKAWHGFLGRLKQIRPQAPLNGIVLTVGLDELLPSLTSTERNLTALALRKRLKDISTSLDANMPIYVVITKMDLLPGFIETFQRFNDDQLKQSWGVQAQHQEMSHSFIKGFPEQFETLVNQLAQQRLQSLVRLHSADQAKLIHEFPQELAKLSNSFEALLNTVFETSQFEQPYLFRGLYFVSSTQEQYSPEWLEKSIAKPLAPAPVSSKPYFVDGLLSHRIFPEAGLAALKSKSAVRLKLLMSAGYAGVISLFIAGGFGLATSFYANAKTNTEYYESLNVIQSALTNNTSMQVEWHRLLQDLNQIQHLPKGYADDDKSAAFGESFGLYQGHKIGVAADQLYFESLELLYLPNIASLLENALQYAQTDEQQYDALRMYLMFFDQTHRDEKALEAYIDSLLLNANVFDEERAGLLSHLAIAFAEQRSLPEANKELVASTRSHLLEMPEDLRVYLRIKSELQHSQSRYSLSNSLGRQSKRLFDYDEKSAYVQGLFTSDGYYQSFKPRLDDLKSHVVGERWVLEDAITIIPSELDTLKNNIAKRYAQEYISQWSNFVQNIKIKTFSNANQGLDVLQVLVDQQQPIMKVIKAVHMNTALLKPEKTKNEQAATDLAFKKNPNLKELNRIGNTFDIKEDGVAAQLIRQHFESFNADFEAKTKYTALQSALLGMLPYYQSLVYSDERAEPNADTILALRAAVDRLDPLLKGWLPQTVSQTQAMIARNASYSLNQAWQEEIVQFYRANIQGRYPVNADSPDDISIADFTAFFAPSGLLDQFYQQHIKAKVEIRNGRLAWRGQHTGSRNLLRLYDQLRQIQLAYFSQGELNVPFRLTPKSLDSNVQHIKLALLGQDLVFDHAQPRDFYFHISEQTLLAQNQLTMQLTSGRLLHKDLQGPWGLFRLIDESNGLKTSRSNSLYQMDISVQGLNASFILEPSKRQNPFNTDLLSVLHFPVRL
ncbi:MAG: type VI secretion system membrane subunit TssM [Pseudomonadota bacterium]|nr:type VI secretion system membrane subunit TssM [Pseudomonadota bacterium]